MTKPIDGVTQFGSTEQTIALAKALYKSPENRHALRKWLNIFETEIKYSNEDFDRKSGLAADLADMIRN